MELISIGAHTYKIKKQNTKRYYTTLQSHANILGQGFYRLLIIQMIIYFGRLKNHTYINYWFLKKNKQYKYQILNNNN